MVCSMTGFGRSKQTTERMSVIVEMKSVNHRFCEISIRLPRQLVIFEDKIKKSDLTVRAKRKSRSIYYD